MTFKQYITEAEGMHINDINDPDPTSPSFQRDQLEDLKTIITNDPFNYTWNYDTAKPISRVVIVAERNLDRAAVYTTSPYRNFQTYVERDSDNYLCYNVEYPSIEWNQFSGFTDADPIDFEKHPLFKISKMQIYDPTNLVPLSDDDAPFQPFAVYNYYLSSSGTMPEKVINTLEYIRDYWKRSGWWGEKDDALLLRAKMRYLPKDKITKRDFIRGALMDAL